MDRREAVQENPPGGTPPFPETPVVKRDSTQQELGLSTSQEGSPQLLRKAWPLESLRTKGYLVETPKDHQLNQENGQRETKRRLCERGVDPASAGLQGGGQLNTKGAPIKGRDGTW